MNISNRHFKFWEYLVSHNQLLLRSPQNNEIPRNLDIRFWGVEYLDLPTKFDNPSLVSPEPGDFLKAEQALGKKLREKEENLFVFQIDNRRHIIVALAMQIYENDLDIFETSLSI